METTTTTTIVTLTQKDRVKRMGWAVVKDTNERVFVPFNMCRNSTEGWHYHAKLERNSKGLRAIAWGQAWVDPEIIEMERQAMAIRQARYNLLEESSRKARKKFEAIAAKNGIQYIGGKFLYDHFISQKREGFTITNILDRYWYNVETKRWELQRQLEKPANLENILPAFHNEREITGIPHDIYLFNDTIGWINSDSLFVPIMSLAEYEAKVSELNAFVETWGITPRGDIRNAETLAQHIIRTEEREELQRSFDSNDYDDSGMFSAAELKTVKVVEHTYLIAGFERRRNTWGKIV